MEKERKILFQIAREKDEIMSFTSNELTPLEMRALVSYMKDILKYFQEELEITHEEDLEYE